MLIGCGKILVLLSLLPIFIQLEIVAGILFDEQSGLSISENALTSLVLLLTNLSGLLPKTSLTTSVNHPFLLLFALMILLLILQLKANHLFGLLFSSNSTLDDSGIPLPPLSPLRCPMPLPVISFDRVHELLKSMNIRKAGGPDGIPLQVLRKCASVLTPPLV